MLHCVTPNIRELSKLEILIERVREVAKYFERMINLSIFKVSGRPGPTKPCQGAPGKGREEAGERRRASGRKFIVQSC